jgi:hypothetical protein
MFASAVALGVAFFGVITANTVCPDHALWIDALATFTVVLTVTAVVATLKASAAASIITLAACCGGLSIAAVDGVHEITRSRVIAIAFAVAGLLSAFSAMTAMRLRRWESVVVADALRPLPAELSAPATDGSSPTTAPVSVGADEVRVLDHS